MYDVNPMQIIQMIRSGQNPQQIMLGILQGPMGQTPLGANLLSLAQKGDTAGIEKIVRNMYSERGMDFDNEFKAFRQMYGL